ncbi:MAG: lipopolysaccharide biosynthesis protein [Flavisolibacter sp.]
MSTIRKQSIISSVIVYFGFALGLFNTYLFTREGGFTEEQYGLTGTFIAFANIMFSVAGLAMPGYIAKFFPYYKAHLSDRENDQLSWALLLPCFGFLVVMLLGLGFKNILIDKIFNNSPELLQFYYWTFPFGFGYTIFMVLESYAWQQRRAVLSNFLKEVLFRLIVTVLIVLTTLQLIRNFSEFIHLYALAYIALVLVMLFIFYRSRQLHFRFSASRVTRRFYRKIVALVIFVWGGGLVFNIASVFDTIIIAAVLPNGMRALAPFLLAQNISSLMQAPQRAVISAAVGPLSQSWKEKDLSKIGRIYQRSSINQLIFSSALFCLIWLNFDDAISSFHLQSGYMQARQVFFFLGIAKIIDMGTGLNAQIIGTSTFWRFEFTSGLILLALTLPLNWELTRYMGILGPAISNLISFSIYNLIRYLFLWRKFRMQPFTPATIYTLVLAFICYMVSFWLLRREQGFLWITVRSLLFCITFGIGLVGLKLSPDLQPVLLTIKKRIWRKG